MNLATICKNSWRQPAGMVDVHHMSFGEALMLVPKAFVSGTGLQGLWNAMGSGAIIGTSTAGLTNASAKDTALGGLLGEVGGAAGYGTSLGLHAAMDALQKSLPCLYTVINASEFLGGGKMIEEWPHFAAAMAAINGGMAGGREIYNFRDGSGFLAFGLDSSWSLDDTFRGNLLQFTVAQQYDAAKSAGQNRTVYDHGLILNGSGYAHTQGNVTIAMDEAPNAYSHEGTHILQSHIFGPTFDPLYMSFSAVEGLVGIGVWMSGGLIISPQQGLNDVQWFGYYANPFELWAYGQNWGAWQYHTSELNPGAH